MDKSRLVDVLKEENQQLREYNAKVIEIEKSYRQNRELTARIANLAGIEIENLSAPGGPGTAPNDSTFAPRIERESVTGAPADTPALTLEQLEKMRVPQGRPLYGWITRGFDTSQNYGKEKHDGVDIAVKNGTPVVAAATGEVAFAGWDKDLGNMIILDHGNGYKTVYGHNQSIMVGLGDKVFKGKTIALSGNSGHSSAPHLHYGIIKDGEPVDPSPYID